jgi:hypothetical protein
MAISNCSILASRRMIQSSLCPKRVGTSYKKSTKRADSATAAEKATEQENNVLRQRLSEFGIDPDSIK